MIKHILPIYYNPEDKGFHVIFDVEGDELIVGNCARYIDDALTNRQRFKIPIVMLNRFERLYKRKIESYSFISKRSDGQLYAKDDGNIFSSFSRRESVITLPLVERGSYEEYLKT